MYGRSPTSGTRPNHPFAPEDTLLQSTAKVTGVDEARIRKFAEEQARLERAHSPATPLTDPAIRKFAEEQARLHRAHSPDIPRNETHLKFAEEQARLQRARSPELPRSATDSKSKFAEEQARLHRARSPGTLSLCPCVPGGDINTSFLHKDIPRNETRTKASRTPTNSTDAADAARLAAFAEQQLRAQTQFAQDQVRASSSSRLGQNSQALRGKSTSTPTPVPTTTAYIPTIGRRSMGSGTQATSMFGRFPLNEPDDITSAYESYDSNLTSVEVLFFDLDGTVLNWQGSVAEELRRLGNKHFPEIHDKVDWDGFALRWRDLYLTAIRDLAAHGDSLAPSAVYRTTLDQLLAKENKQFAARWTPTVRNQLVEIWDRCQAWPDTKDGLKAMNTIKTIVTLSNLPLRTQTQINRHAGLSWDLCLSCSLLGAYKPYLNLVSFMLEFRIKLSDFLRNPEAYMEAARSMSLPVSKCAVVSARSEELRLAGAAGMKTVYVRRASEDRDVETEQLVSKLEGGEFDVVVDSFEHLAIVLGCDD
ncbi:hypothetical protein MSAN_00229600 [Mycena sanguinolenta]|uniref:HAD-like protein n=1 Tax=Mycena sanguinolenta TaxID=230812 RepID=A0A8H7DNW7_9AGAR|nr:hypothetical protein MSAN_00229600 [Mycena sanguinolenta]